jgi:prophage tail gpP-like protein
MSFNPLEIATVTVAGVQYREFTRIEAEREFPAIWSYCTFDAIEPSTMQGGHAMPISALQIMAGAKAQVTLGGQLAVTGEVDIRSVDYTKDSHNIKIRVASNTQAALHQSVKAAPGEYKHQSLQQIASAVLAPINIKALVGPGAEKPFPVVRENPGESVAEFIERLARHRGMHITDDANGNLLFDTLSTTGGSADFVEGGNIIRAHLHIKSTFGTLQMEGKGQPQASTDTNIASIPNAESVASRAGAHLLPNSIPYRQIIAEMPADSADLQMRLGHQVSLDSMELLEATISVSGWFSPSGQLWMNLVTSPPTAATLKSQMLIPLDMAMPPLFIKKARHYQSNEEGTMTDVTIAIMKTVIGGGGAFFTPPGHA